MYPTAVTVLMVLITFRACIMVRITKVDGIVVGIVTDADFNFYRIGFNTYTSISDV